MSAWDCSVVRYICTYSRRYQNEFTFSVVINIAFSKYSFLIRFFPAWLLYDLIIMTAECNWRRKNDVLQRNWIWVIFSTLTTVCFIYIDRSKLALRNLSLSFILNQTSFGIFGYTIDMFKPHCKISTFDEVKNCDKYFQSNLARNWEVGQWRHRSPRPLFQSQGQPQD